MCSGLASFSSPPKTTRASISPTNSTPDKTPSPSGGGASPNSDSTASSTNQGAGVNAKYTEPLIERIVEDTLHTTPEQATHWSTRTMAEHAGVSHTTVQRIWHAHELKPHLRTFKLSNDKYFVEKLRDASLSQSPEHALVFCVGNHKSRPLTAPNRDCP